MTYIVTWSNVAFRQLSDLANEADDPGRIQGASDWIDYALRRFPLDLGESRSGDERVWYGDVLGVRFKVDRDADKVYVLSIGLSRRPRKR